MKNRQWLLSSRPTGDVDPTHFRLVEEELSETPPATQRVLLRTEMVLCAPTIRNWISGNRSSYYPTIEIGQAIIAPVVGRVVASEDARYPIGTRLAGFGSWQDYQWINPTSGYQALEDEIASADALGVFGMNAFAAYFGLLDVGRLKAEDVLLVSGAAGSVGSVAAQIGRIKGARVVGICGGSDKAAWLREACGIDEVIDYRSEDVPARLDAFCPDGVDVYFDNVGGDLLREVVARIRPHGRIALCGQIATYNAGADDPALDMMRIIYGSITLSGFVVSEYANRFSEALPDLRKWKQSGELAHREDVREGFLELPKIFASLFSGTNKGTLIARVSDADGQPL